MSPLEMDPDSASTQHKVTPGEIVALWFSERVKPLWFNSTAEFDAELREKYAASFEAALQGKLSSWEETPQGVLALVILLDQLPLNMYRGTVRSFVGEAQSREVAARAIEQGLDQSLSGEQKAFLYIPYMHSEILADQDRAIALFKAAGLGDNLKWAEHHREIVRRFGRFPHRNAILGRESSAEELAYLQSEEGFQG